MNRAQLVQLLAGRLGGERAAADALDAVLSEIQSAVAEGDRVLLVGFGVFEQRLRPARTVRHPRTGRMMRLAATAVPAFRAGSRFRASVRGGAVPDGGATMRLALGHLDARGFGATAGCRRALAAIIDQGERALAGRQAAVTAGTARRNLLALLDSATRLAADRGRETVDERVLRSALRGLCPLPPWCRDD